MSLTQFAEIQIPIELRAMIKQKKGNKSYHAYLRELIEKSEGQDSESRPSVESTGKEDPIIE